MKLSLVVPCYNEADNVAPFQDAVISAFDGCGYDFEIIFVNDGSRDATLHNLKKLHAQQKCPVKVISFSRNFGKEAGLYAGLQHASGEYISLIDADLQQRPEIVRDMVAILDEQPQYDVVAAYQDRRGEGKVLSFFKKSFYAIINKLSDELLSHPSKVARQKSRRLPARSRPGAAPFPAQGANATLFGRLRSFLTPIPGPLPVHRQGLHKTGGLLRSIGCGGSAHRFQPAGQRGPGGFGIGPAQRILGVDGLHIALHPGDAGVPAGAD